FKWCGLFRQNEESRKETVKKMESADFSKAECNASLSRDVFLTKTERSILENPDLPIDFIQDVLIAKVSDRSLAELFTPE
ncbi:hypothetical protein LJC31_08520, partial [Synergistaceae bacterium OttesenSCG-928-I11]|nr:hypothetical protein [Synergistaceae bacterium OttesenSCG-928-I11]